MVEQNMKTWIYPLWIATSFVLLIDAQENAYTSVESIKAALKLDLKFASFFSQSLRDLDEYRELVQRYLDEQGETENELQIFSKEKQEIGEDSQMSSKLAGNPLIAFQAIRRLVVDVHTLSTRLNAMADGLEDLIEDVKNSESVKVTYKEDLSGAATGILRLQATYHMAASDLVDGKIQHLNTTSRLTVSDCLLIAHAAKDMSSLDHYAEWREQADILCKKMAEKQDGCRRITESLLMEAVLEHDEIRDHYAEEISKNASFFMEKHVFPKRLQRVSATDQRRNINSKKLHGPKTTNSLCFLSNELLDEEERSKLSCYYLRNPDDPYVTLQRFKMEVQSRNPQITTVYDVISSEEADFIKETAKPVLTRSQVVEEGSKDYVNTEHRISQTAWIDDDNLGMAAISKRIGRITGLATEGDNAEPLQVVNYGIGGLFVAHYDALDSIEQFESQLGFSDYMGNRMVTFILYLSDVELGGATYFPNANVSVYPKKGSATMWYNLDDAGNLDPKSYHGGCPVLYGSKWIANKWILERGQVFRKPCLPKIPA